MKNDKNERRRMLENFESNMEEYRNNIYGENIGRTITILNFIMICIDNIEIASRIRNIIHRPENEMELELAKLYVKAFSEYYDLKEKLLMEKEREITVENNPAIEPLINIVNQLKSGKSLDAIEEPESIKGQEGKYTYLFLLSLNNQTIKDYIQNKTGMELNNQDRAEETKILIDKICLLPMFYKGIPKSVIDKEIITDMKEYVNQFHFCCEQEKPYRKAMKFAKEEVVPALDDARQKVLSLWKNRKKK